MTTTADKIMALEAVAASVIRFAISALPLPSPADALREAVGLPEVRALVEAAEVFARWDHCWPGNINLTASAQKVYDALANLKGVK